MFDEVFDVIVVGSGFAGLSAAIEARNAGCSVLVIEKMRVPGGNSALSGGLIAVANSPLQEVANISDSPARLANDMLKAGKALNHPALIQTVSEKSREIFLWTRDYLGVAFNDTLIHGGGHSVPRIYNPVTCTGAIIVQALLVKCRELDIPIRMQCASKNLIRDDSGRVVGVTVASNYIFPQQNSGIIRRIRAHKAVVLASGGFCQDVEFRMIQNARLDSSLETTNHPGATAEALVSALKIGATPVHLSWVQMGPWTSRDEKGWGGSAMFSLLSGFPNGIMFDATTGKRFVNELTDRLSISQEMTLAGRDPMLIVGGEAARLHPNLTQCLKRKVVKRYDTLETLALDQSINAAALAATLRKYNESVDHGVDREFGKPLGPNNRHKITPPYYLVRLRPKIHYCNGGIQINTRAQVMDVEHHQPIPGLYAAGEVTGGVHGACRIGGTAISECLVFGRIAGANAAQEGQSAGVPDNHAM